MKKPLTGIAVDASTRGNPGPSEYKGVDIATGKILFHINIDVATNNITEFIALSHAVIQATKDDIKTDIYTDSVTALSWLLKKKANSNLTPGRNTAKAIDLLKRVEIALKKLDISKVGSDELLVNSNISVLKWYTSEWGEIPADFGIKNTY
jgi:ribonuclease HI